MSAIVLFHGQPNGPSLSVLASLEESGLTVECRLIDLLKGERHSLPGVTEAQAMALAVEGEGPVILAGGEAMAEAVFLAQYLDETAGGCGLQPDDPHVHWQMLMWCRQVTERLAPAVAYLGNLTWSQPLLAAMPASDFEALLTRIASEDLRLRWQELRAGTLDEDKAADSAAKIAQFAQRTEDQLADGREWLMGSFSIADLETFAWLTGAQALEPSAFDDKANLKAWMQRTRARPSVERALARATVAKPEQSFAPGPEINRWG